MCSDAGGGAVYDILGFAHPLVTLAHDTSPFSTPYQDLDTVVNYNCAGSIGGRSSDQR